MAKDKKIPANLVFTKEKFTYDTIEELKQDIGLTVGNVVTVNGHNSNDDEHFQKMIIVNENTSGLNIPLNNGFYAKTLIRFANNKELEEMFNLPVGEQLDEIQFASDQDIENIFN